MLHHQRGASFYTTLLLVLLLIFTGLFAFRVGMPIMDNWTVKKIIASIAQEPQVERLSNADIRNIISKKFDVNRVEHINVRQDVHIENDAGLRRITANYEARVPFFANIELVVKFDKNEVELPLQR